jgi:hypothetical protein
VLQIREQSSHESVCMSNLFAPHEALDKGIHEPFQPRHDVVKDLRC